MTITAVRKQFSTLLLSKSQAQLVCLFSCAPHLLGLYRYNRSLLLPLCRCYCSFVSETPIDKFLNHILKNNSILQDGETLVCNKSTSRKKKFLPKRNHLFVEAATEQVNDANFTSVCVPRKDYTIQKLLLTKGPEACLESLRLEDDISKYSFDSASVKKLCHTASVAGYVSLVEKLLKVAETNFVQSPQTYKELRPFLALAEFSAGNYSACFEALNNIYEIKKFVSHKNELRTMQMMQQKFFRKSSSGILQDTTALIIAQIPQVGQASDLDKADELVRLLEELLNLSWPAFTLWQGYFFSTSQNELARADALYESKGVQKLTLRNLCLVVEQLLTLHSVSQVQHFLELLLQHNQHSALPIITSLLLSMHCTDGNWRAAVEVLHFATSLKLRLSYNSLLRLQQLLHQHSVPLPQQLMQLKYLEASNAGKKLPPVFKF